MKTNNMPDIQAGVHKQNNILWSSFLYLTC